MEWKDIIGYEGLYKVNENGDVISLRNNHILKPFIIRDHYAVNICKGKKRTTYYLHRLVYEAFNGKIPDGYIVCHITSDLSNNSLSNLKLYSSVKERYMDKNADTVNTSSSSSRREKEKAVDLDGEIWVDALDSDGRYKVSNFGRVKNKKGYIIRPYLKRRTYFCILLSISKGRTINVFVHRLVYESFNGRISSGNVVDHIDSNPLNNKLENLREITKLENYKNVNSNKKSNDIKNIVWKNNGGKSGIVIFKINKRGEILNRYNSISIAANEICTNAKTFRQKVKENGMLEKDDFIYVPEDKYESLLAELPCS